MRTILLATAALLLAPAAADAHVLVSPDTAPARPFYLRAPDAKPSLAAEAPQPSTPS